MVIVATQLHFTTFCFELMVLFCLKRPLLIYIVVNRKMIRKETFAAIERFVLKGLSS